MTSQSESRCKTCGSRAPHLYGSGVKCPDVFHLQQRQAFDPRRLAQRQSPMVSFDTRDDWEVERHFAEMAMERD